MNLRTALLLTTLGLLLFNNSKAQTIQESEQILVRTFEVWTSMYPSEIVISYGEGKTERISLENLKQKNWETNADKINEVLNNIRKAGYTINSSNAGGGDGVYITSYVFLKEE